MRNQRRFLVYAGVFVMMMFCYIDRINLAVAAKPIAAAYHLSPIQLGYFFSSFLWTYLVLLIPLGIAVDRWGSRLVTSGSLALWSAAGIFTGIATTYPGLIASRLLLGVGEAASYPAGGRIVREWAPRSERGIASALLNSGAYAGLAVGAPIVGWIVTDFGWKESFYVTGGVGLILAVAWYALYRRPESASWLSSAERIRILAERDDGESSEGRTQSSPLRTGSSLLMLLRSPAMWGLALTQGCAGYTLYLFMTWLPTYLADSRGLDVMRSGAFSAVPYAAAVPLGLLLGRLSDRSLRKDAIASGGRRRIIATCLLASSVILLTPFVTNIWIILALFSVSLTCVSTAMGMNIALTNDLLTDSSRAGMAVSMLILGGNSFGVVAPIATGYVVASPLGYSGAFAIAGVLLLAGAAISITLTGRSIDADTVSPGQPARAIRQTT